MAYSVPEVLNIYIDNKYLLSEFKGRFSSSSSSILFFASPFFCFVYPCRSRTTYLSYQSLFYTATRVSNYLPFTRQSLFSLFYTASLHLIIIPRKNILSYFTRSPKSYITIDLFICLFTARKYAFGPYFIKGIDDYFILSVNFHGQNVHYQLVQT